MPDNFRTPVDERYFTTAGLAAGLTRHAASYGIDLPSICAGLGIDPASFSDMTRRVAMDRMCRLFEACAVISGDEAFGVKAVSSYVSGSTGPFGYGLITAPNVESFIHFLHDHRRAVSHTINMALSSGDGYLSTSWSYSPLIIRREQYVDFVIALVAERLRPYLGEDMQRVEYWLERDKPAKTAAHHKYMSKKIRFGAPINSIRVPVDLLSRSNPAGDEKLFRIMDMQCRMIEPPYRDDNDFSEELRDYLQANMARSTIKLDEVAAYFHLSERTLQRRLAERNTTLNDLRDEVRKELASRLLTDTELPFAEIAARLGYSAASALTRSMIRWHGVTPSDFRQRRKK